MKNIVFQNLTTLSIDTIKSWMKKKCAYLYRTPFMDNAFYG